MRKAPVWLAVFASVALTLLLMARPAAAASDIDRQWQETSQEIRCPICKGQSSWDSDTTPANQIKDDVRQRLLSGQTKQQILDAYEKDYGAWILMSPPRRGFSLTAYLAPLGLMVVGYIAIVWLMRRSKQVAAEGATAAAAAGSVSAEDQQYEEQVQETLRKYL